MFVNLLISIANEFFSGIAVIGSRNASFTPLSYLCCLKGVRSAPWIFELSVYWSRF
jgi:hypothetical protein